MIQIPTIAELTTQILDDLQAEFGSSIPAFGKNFLRAFATVQAAKLKLYYLAIGHLQKNIFVDTADAEASGGTLQRFGRIKLGRDPFPSTAGQYDLEVTGTVGATIKGQTTFKSDDTSTNPGKLFILDADFILAANPDTITVRALETGEESKLSVGNTLTATSPIANVNESAEVTAEALAPTPGETLEEYRQKVLDAYQAEPQGGAATDYRLWAADAQGVQRVYPYAKSGAPGEINLFVEATEADSTDGKGTPSAALLDDVEDVVDFDPDVSKPLEDRGRRPLQVIVNYLAVTIKEISIEITDYTGLTAEIEAQNLTALKALIADIRPFVAAADIVTNQNDVLNINKIIGTLLEVRPGAIFGLVVLKVDGVSVSTVTFLDGDIPYLDTVVYV